MFHFFRLFFLTKLKRFFDKISITTKEESSECVFVYGFAFPSFLAIEINDLTDIEIEDDDANALEHTTYKEIILFRETTPPSNHFWIQIPLNYLNQLQVPRIDVLMNYGSVVRVVASDIR